MSSLISTAKSKAETIQQNLQQLKARKSTGEEGQASAPVAAAAEHLADTATQQASALANALATVAAE